LALPLVFVVCLIFAGITFLLGWLCAKVHFGTVRDGSGEQTNRDASSSPEPAELPAALQELQSTVEQLQEERAQLKERLNTQQQMLANVTEDRDRIRVEHGTQRRQIHSLESSKFDRDKAQLQFNKQQKLWHAETRKLTEQIQTLETRLKTAEQMRSGNPNAPLPTGVADGVSTDVRQELANNREQVASLTSQLQALQDWARPLAKENEQLKEVLERLKQQILALRNDRQQAERQIADLSAQVAAAASEPPLQSHRDNVPEQPAAAEPYAETTTDPLEETHTDLEAADDLKQLPGIGPSLERKLNSEGIFRYEQIAGLSVDDIASLMKRISARTSRKKRNAWPTEARRLENNKNGGFENTRAAN